MARNPPAIPPDTSREAFLAQMQAIAGRSVPERLEEWTELNRAVAEMEAVSVRRRHPDYDDRQVFLALVRRRYGDELAATVWPDSASVEP